MRALFVIRLHDFQKDGAAQDCHKQKPHLRREQRTLFHTRQILQGLSSVYCGRFTHTVWAHVQCGLLSSLNNGVWRYYGKSLGGYLRRSSGLDSVRNCGRWPLRLDVRRSTPFTLEQALRSSGLGVPFDWNSHLWCCLAYSGRFIARYHYCESWPCFPPNRASFHNNHFQMQQQNTHIYLRKSVYICIARAPNISFDALITSANLRRSITQIK